MIFFMLLGCGKNDNNLYTKRYCLSDFGRKVTSQSLKILHLILYKTVHFISQGQSSWIVLIVKHEQKKRYSQSSKKSLFWKAVSIAFDVYILLSKMIQKEYLCEVEFTVLCRVEHNTDGVIPYASFDIIIHCFKNNLTAKDSGLTTIPHELRPSLSCVLVSLFLMALLGIGYSSSVCEDIFSSSL